MFIKKALHFIRLYAFIPLFFVVIGIICYIPEIFVAKDYANSSFAESWDNSIASLPETSQYLGVYTEKTMYSPTRHLIFCDNKDNNVIFFAVDARGVTSVSYSKDEIACVTDSQLTEIFNYKIGTEDTPYTIESQEAYSYKNFWARDLYILEEPNISYIGKIKSDPPNKETSLIFEKRSGKKVTLLSVDHIGLHKIDTFCYKEQVSYSKDVFKNIYVKIDDKAYILKYIDNNVKLKKR